MTVTHILADAETERCTTEAFFRITLRFQDLSCGTLQNLRDDYAIYLEYASRLWLCVFCLNLWLCLLGEKVLTWYFSLARLNHLMWINNNTTSLFFIKKKQKKKLFHVLSGECHKMTCDSHLKKYSDATSTENLENCVFCLFFLMDLIFGSIILLFLILQDVYAVLSI